MNICFIYLILFFISINKILTKGILDKYSSKKVSCPNIKKIVFNSTDFNLKEDMYFTFSLDAKGLDKTIYYQFYENIDISDSKSLESLQASNSKEPDSSTNKKKKKVVKSETKYYTINKDKENNFLLLQFDCKKGTLTIENTKKSGAKTNKILIIIIICVSVLVTAIIIIVVLIRRKNANLSREKLMQQSRSGYFPQSGFNGISRYGNNQMMNNYPPQNNIMMEQQPVPHSNIKNNDVGQLTTNVPNSKVPHQSVKKGGVKKRKKQKIKKNGSLI